MDRLHLMVHPIAARTGFRLFDEGQPPIPLRLISSEPFQTGVLNLVYVAGRGPGMTQARPIRRATDDA